MGHSRPERLFMESRQHIDLPRGGRGRAVWLLVLGLALVAAGIWLRGRGLNLLHEQLGAEVAAPDDTDARVQPPGTAPGDTGPLSLAPVRSRGLHRQDDREVPAPGASSIAVDDAEFDESSVWTIRFVPVHPDGFPLAGVEAQLVTAKPVISHWRGHVPFEPGEAVELEVSGPPEVILNAGLWVATDPGTLTSLDGRVLRGAPSTRAGVRIDVASLATVDREARTIDLGRVALEFPKRLGTVSLLGRWVDPVHVLVSAPTKPDLVWGWGQGARRFDLAASERSLTVSAYLVHHDHVSAVWSAAAWTDENPVRAKDEASIGVSIGLESPTLSGLDLSVDVVALPKASRIVIPATGSTHGATLDQEAYQALLLGARWTAVVPQSIVKAGKARYDLGYQSFPDGPAQIEVWSIKNKEGLRTLLFQTAVDVQGDVLPVLLR